MQKNEQDCQGLGFRKGLKFSFVSRVSRVYIYMGLFFRVWLLCFSSFHSHSRLLQLVQATVGF